MYTHIINVIIYAAQILIKNHLVISKNYHLEEFIILLVMNIFG